MRTREIEDLKRRLSLTLTQRSVLVGAVLGDASLVPASSGRSIARLKFEQQARHREYVGWLYKVFQAYGC